MSEPKTEGPRPAPQSRNSAPAPGASVTSTAATAMTTAGSGGWVLWIFQCLEADKLVTPSTETALFMAAAILPIAQTLRNGLNVALGRWFKVEPARE